MEQENNIVIIGAGMSGLGAWFADQETDIYEAHDYAGGLCAGFDVDGFHFDQAVHISFSKIDFIKCLFEETEHHTHRVAPMSWYEDRWLKHPIQNNLFPLDAEKKVNAVKSFIERINQGERNFKEWTISRYGEYLWDTFFEPYNKKYWCMDLSELDTCWLGNRFYQPTIEEVLRGSYTDNTPNTYYATEMRYPQKGGYFEFVRKIAEKASEQGKLHYNKRVVSIDTKAHLVTFNDETRITYTKMFSSIPMDNMLMIIQDLPEKYKDKEKEFEHTGVAIVSFGLKKCDVEHIWFYIYDQDIMAARAYLPFVKAKENVPKGKKSIQFEIYFNTKENEPDRIKSIDNSIYALEKMNICKKRDIVVSDFRILKYGNTIFKKATNNMAKDIRKWMREHDIIPIGRFGRWEYLWSDQAFMSGYLSMMKYNR